MKTLRLAALVSGNGRNLQSIIDAIDQHRLDARIEVVISSRPGVMALERAEKRGIPTITLPRRRFPSTEDYSCALVAALSPYDIDLVVLCGFLSFLSKGMVDAYRGRMMNIHPSLLPSFGGKGAFGANVHQMVMDYGAKVSGCTVMFVDESEDGGPIIIQKPVLVQEDDDADSLGQRVMQAEWEAYPEAIRLFGEGRLRIEGRRVVVVPKTKGVCLL